MIASNLLYIAILVFVLMLIGLVLTALEFRHGAPHRQEEEARKNLQESDTSQQ
jgi:hypothetical protein